MHETHKECKACSIIYKPEQLLKWVPPQSNYGYDIIEYIGRALFIENKSEKQIWSELRNLNVWISESEVRHLGRRFIVYLAVLQEVSQPAIQQFLNSNGGYLLHIDGTCEAGSPHLIAVMDSITNTVLGSTKVLSEAAEHIIPFLEEIKHQYGNPIAALSDMSRAFANAIKIVFPDVVHFICHFHFLRDLGKDLFNDEYAILRDEIRRYKIRADLNSLKRELKQMIKDTSFLKDAFDRCTQIESLQESLPVEVKTYLLIRWIFDSETELNGYGFPFDRAHLVLYKRMQNVLNTLNGYQSCTGYLEFLRTKLIYFLEDQGVKNTVKSLEKKIEYFDQLRVAMRIAQPEGKNGLNDEGDNDIGQIEKAVRAFLDSPALQELVAINDDFAQMDKQIRKRWKQLFTDPIVIEKDGKKHVIQPQRTNNILERLFRDSQNHYRRKTGKNSRAKALQTMFAETLLVKNLQNPDIYKILLNGKETLAERFTELSSRFVQKKLEFIEDQEGRLSPAIKRILRETEQFPAQLLKLIA